MKLFHSLFVPFAIYNRVLNRGAQNILIHSQLLSTAKPSKVERIPIVLNDDEIEESFVKGSGPGGQKINKRSNRVRLVHIPTGTTVSCQDYRDLTSNRKHARTMLKNKLDVLVNGDNSKLAKKIEKIRKRKKKSASRAVKKYGTGKPGDSTSNSTVTLAAGDNDIDSDEEDDDDDDFDEPNDKSKEDKREKPNDIEDDDDEDDEEDEENERNDKHDDPDRRDYFHK